MIPFPSDLGKAIGGVLLDELYNRSSWLIDQVWEWLWIMKREYK